MIVYNVTYAVKYRWDEDIDKKQEIMGAINELAYELAKILLEEEKTR